MFVCVRVCVHVVLCVCIRISDKAKTFPPRKYSEVGENILHLDRAAVAHMDE